MSPNTRPFIPISGTAAANPKKLNLDALLNSQVAKNSFDTYVSTYAQAT